MYAGMGAAAERWREASLAIVAGGNSSGREREEDTKIKEDWQEQMHTCKSVPLCG